MPLVFGLPLDVDIKMVRGNLTASAVGELREAERYSVAGSISQNFE